MTDQIDRLAIIGQGLIGSSITRGVYERGLARHVTVTDATPKVRRRVIDLGLGQAKVVASNREAVADADLVIACVPVGQLGAVAADIGPHLKPGAIVSDVGSVKASVVADMLPFIPKSAHLVPAHPLAGTENSGPDAGLPRLFVNRWCILTPPDGADLAAVGIVQRFWQALGAHVEIMPPERHDHVLAITSHLPHLIAFTIFHTAMNYESRTQSEAIKFSAGGFRDFTRIASSNPTMWRDIFLNNRAPCLEILKEFMGDLSLLAKAIEEGDGAELERYFSTSRKTRRRLIEKEHISVAGKDPQPGDEGPRLIRPYAWND